MQIMLGLFLGALAIGVSFISGLFGGVGFWNILLRALLSGIVFWVLGILLGMVLKSILVVHSSVNSETGDKTLGSTVDIIHDDNIQTPGFEETPNNDYSEADDISVDFTRDETLSDDDFSDASLAGLKQEDPVNIARGIQTILESEKK